MNLHVGQEGKPELGIGMLPGRKRPCLYLWHRTHVEVLASFRSDHAAEQAERFFVALIGTAIVDGREELTAAEAEQLGVVT